MKVNGLNKAHSAFAQGDFQEYIFSRGNYLDLCRRYHFKCRDLSIMEVIASEFSNREDKLIMVKLILKMCALEKKLGDILDDALFPETVKELEHSGILLPQRRRH